MSHKVFVSKPTALNDQQAAFWGMLEPILMDRGFAPQSLGTKNYTNQAPMLAVKQLMHECEGAIVLGFRQMHVLDAVEKEGTSKRAVCRDVCFPTAWNHIEGAMALMLDLPLLVIRESSVRCDGIFDFGSTARYVHEASVEDKAWLRKQQFLQPFNEWIEEVVRSTGQ